MEHGDCNGAHNAYNFAPKSCARYMVETVGGIYYFSCDGCALRFADRNMGIIKEMEQPK